MSEALSFKVDWKTWNAKLKALNSLPQHIAVMTKSLTIFGVEKLKKLTPRSRGQGEHLAESWETNIFGTNPIQIQIYNVQRHRELVLRILEFGSKNHEITPRKKTALKFMWRGRLVYTKQVEHGGTKPYAMIAQTRADMMIRVSYLKQMVLREFVNKVEGAR